MENAEKQLIELFKDDNTNITREGIKYTGEMVKWILDLIKLDFETNKDIMTPEGYILYFDMDSVRCNLCISKLSDFYSYSEFNICILQPLIKLMRIKYGFDIKIEGIDNPVRRFKMVVHKVRKNKQLIKITKDVLEQSNIIKEFSEICNVVVADDGDYNIDNIMEMCKCTDKLQKYEWNTEAVEMAISYLQYKNTKGKEVDVIVTEKVDEKNIVISHWSNDFKNRVIELWQSEYVKRLGVLPKKGEAKKIFAPAMYDLLRTEFPEELKAHSINRDGSKKLKAEVVLLLYYRYMAWIETPNKEAITRGEEPPYGVLNILQVNIPSVQIVDNIKKPEECITTVAQAELHRYNVVFKYKLGGLFSKYIDYAQIIEGFTDKDAFYKVLPIFYEDKSIKHTSIKNSSIKITQID